MRTALTLTIATLICFLRPNSVGESEACKRLIKNCIVCWNYLYLSQKLEDSEDAASREAFLEAVANGSAVSWQHINLLGEYDFSDEKLQGYGWNQPPKTRGAKGHIFGSQKERNSKAGMALDKKPISHLVPLLEFNPSATKGGSRIVTNICSARRYVYFVLDTAPLR
jgi:hypothetical protein